MKKLVSHVRDSIPTNKRIAVCVSGGWDSAVLWHIVYEECKRRGQSCRPYTVPKIDGAVKYANQVLAWSGYASKTNIVGSVDAEDPSEYVTSGIFEIFEKGYADICFVAVTKYYDGMTPDHERQHASQYDAEDICIQPFHDLTKDQTVQLAFDLGIADDIMDITHSCTELDEGRCGYCPWCKEREWAFKQINKVDKGTN
jgi:7-cyano-7-deazaguanine synthase in queuosine biosynthesis